MATLDVFKADAFSLHELTDAINKIKFIPGRIGQLGIFTESRVSTNSILVEEKDGALELVASTSRGAPGIALDAIKRNVRTFTVPKFEINGNVMAAQVQGIRAFGTESVLQQVTDMIAEEDMRHANDLAVTEEWLRMGAIKGVVAYPAGSVDGDLDLFSEFSVSKIADVNFDLDAPNPDGGVLREQVAQTTRAMIDELDGVPFDRIHAFCGDAFFDGLLKHSEVRSSFQAEVAQELRQGYVLPGGGTIYGAFEFGGVVWENYRGSVGGNKFVEDDEAHLFPIGLGVFRTVYGPADYMDTVNMPGRRLWQVQYEMANGKGIHLDTQMNALQYCTRPRSLVKGLRT